MTSVDRLWNLGSQDLLWYFGYLVWNDVITMQFFFFTGMVLGVCMTNQPIKDALSSWLKYLQKDNPRLSEFKIIFNVEILSEVMRRP